MVCGKDGATQRANHLVSTRVGSRSGWQRDRPQILLDRQRGAAMFIYLGVIADYPDGQEFAWGVQGLKSYAPAIAVVDLVVAEFDIIDITVPFAREASCAKCQHVLQGCHRYCAAEPEQVIIAGCDLGEPIPLVKTGGHGIHQDSSGQRVATKQGTLWPTQYLDAGHVHQLVHHGTLPRAVDAIHIQPHRRLQPEITGLGADASYSESGVVYATALANLERGSNGGEVEYITDT